MSVSFKAVLRKKYSTDFVGIVNIRKIENSKQSFTSLQIKLPVKLWNDKSGRVRKTDAVDYEGINDQIEDKIEELEKFNSQPQNKPKQTKDSFIDFFNTFNKRIENPGSRIKYETVLSKLKAYLKEASKEDLLFSEIDVNFIYSFKDYSRKTISINTANHYLKLIKQVLNNTITLGLYYYSRHPFLGVEFKNTEIHKSALEQDEILKILKCNIAESDRLFDTRICFITQIFLQGMRVSDLQLLRFSNIVGDNVDYVMFKTKKYMRVFITDIVWNIFIYQFKKFVQVNNIKLKQVERLEDELRQLEQKAIIYLQSLGIRSGFDIIISDKLKDSELNQIMGVEPVFSEIKTVKEAIFSTYKSIIKHFGSQNQDIFIFDFLQGVDFSNIKGNDFSNVTEKQYKIMKNKSIVYDRHLKKLQAKAVISTKLKSHLSRSTYASLLLNSDIDVYSISAALGHSGLNITEKYLTGFKTSKTALINKQLADKFVL